MKTYTVKYYFWEYKDRSELCSDFELNPEDYYTPNKSRKIKSFPDLVSAMMWISENSENDGDNFIGARIDQKVRLDNTNSPDIPF